MPRIDKTDYFSKRTQRQRNGDYQQRRAFKQKVYKSSRWQTMRAAYLMEHPLCEECERLGIITPAIDVHHIESFANHPDNWRAYAYNYNNMMALCKECHGRIHYEQSKDNEI